MATLVVVEEILPSIKHFECWEKRCNELLLLLYSVLAWAKWGLVLSCFPGNLDGILLAVCLYKIPIYNVFPQYKLKCGFIWSHHIFPFCFGPWDELGPRELSSISALNRCIAFSLSNRDSSCISWCSGRLCIKFSQVHVAIFNTVTSWWFLMQCHLRAQRFALPTQTEISLDSLNLFTILCMVVGKITK